MGKYIRGEYWIQDGWVDFADGDIGDRNHEGIAIDHVFHQFLDRIQDLLNEHDIELDSQSGYDDGVDTEEVQRKLSELEDLLTSGQEDDDNVDESKLMSRKQALAYMQQQIGCNDAAFQIIYGRGDARLYVMEHDGWIAVRGNNIELFGWNDKKRKELENGLGEILDQEGIEEGGEDELEFSIYDQQTRRNFDLTWDQIQQPMQVTPQLTQAQPAVNTKYQQSFYHAYNPKDTEENKGQSSAPSSPNPWNKAAQKIKVIGPGQNLWRGTSESYWAFSEWIKRREQ